MRSAFFIMMTLAAMAAILGSALPAMGQDKLGFGDSVSVKVTHGGQLYRGRPIGDYNVINGTSYDVFNGTNRDDLIWGFAGNDCIFGGAGDDSLDGGSGQDACYDRLATILLQIAKNPGQ